MSRRPLDGPQAQALLARHGQEHVLRWVSELTPPARQRLLDQIATLDLGWLERTLAHDPERTDPGAIRPYRDTIRPDDPDREAARRRGETALREGQVGTLLVAGGQGSRLGFDGPKGSYPIGAVSGRSLYQVHADRQLALGRRHGVVPPLYVMTSDSNHEATCELFEARRWFGLPADRVRMFRQGLAPAVDLDGKLLLDARDHVIMAPNGNGGLFSAMQDSGALDHMESLGVRAISYIQVDNPLSPSCDPVFVGYHLLRRSEFSCKAIDKVGPAEKVGCYALVDGRLRIVEYFELPEELARARDEQGALLFGESNPGLFVWSVSFARAQAARNDLPFHRAQKKIPHLDEAGRLVRPEQPNGYKLECFALDTLPDAERSLVLWCDRAAEFAPVKNASGVDSPESARALMTGLYSGWLERAAVRVTDREAHVEINPLFALDAEELQRRVPAGLEVQADLYLGPE